MSNIKINKLISNDEKTMNLIENYKNNNKNYKKLVDILSILGNFDRNINVDIYDIKDTDDEKYVRLWCSDNNDNLFIFYVFSDNQKDLSKVIHFTNNEEFLYDTSLAKKFVIDLENIDFIRSGNIYNFKYGRLITDEKKFYSVYIGDNIGYQIIIDNETENSILSKKVLELLNAIDNKPTFNNFVKIFENVMGNNMDSNNIQVSAYKDFKKTVFIKCKMNEKNVKKLEKKK